MSNNAPIAFIDSGIGGLPYLKWVRDRLPNENFIYLADSKNFPYGEKSHDEVVQIVLKAVEVLHNGKSPKMLVIACNTASVTALEAVREVISIPVIGVVPAVKPAAKISQNKRIGVLATKRTVDGEYIEGLIRDFASNCHVEKVAGSGIVRFVENDFFSSSSDDKDAIFDRAVERFTKEKVDTVVLGCTHFIHMSQNLEERLGSGVKVIDSREGVGNQIIKILKERDILSTEKKEDLFFSSSYENEKSYKKFALKYELKYCGVPQGL